MLRLLAITTLSFVLLMLGVWLLAGGVFGQGLAAGARAQASPTQAPGGEQGHVASSEELRAAYETWSASQHAQTYDDGLGANTTCASCKAPKNWEPSSQAIEAAHDCASCKRVPGAERPVLSGGVEVAENQWKHIGCDICHPPAGDSYWTGIAFWDNDTHRYQEVASVAELCGKCHSDKHGFEVIQEQSDSVAHKNWDCTRCHDPHGGSVSCTDCHNPAAGPGAVEHLRHPNVNCTACHDQGALSIWNETSIDSKFSGQFVPVRFAHALSSWPSHNLGRSVDCLRCHHQRGRRNGLVADRVSCTACHPEGESFFWCEYLPRGLDVNATPTATLQPALINTTP